MHISFLCAECNEKIIWMQSYSLFLFRFVWHKNLPLYFFCVNSCNNLIFTQNLMVRLRCYRMQGNSVVTWQTVVCTFFLCHRLHVLPHDSKKKLYDWIDKLFIISLWIGICDFSNDGDDDGRHVKMVSLHMIAIPINDEFCDNWSELTLFIPYIPLIFLPSILFLHTTHKHPLAHSHKHV